MGRSRSRSRSRLAVANDPTVIKIRGLPYDTKANEVVKFFSNCHIIGGADGIYFPMNERGLATGEAFLEMESPRDLEKALEKHKECIGERYIEVFESRKSVMERVKRTGGAGGEDLRRRRRSTSRSRGRLGFRSRSRERGRPGPGPGGFRGRGEEEWFGGSRGANMGFCVKLRGLPWEATKDDIRDFLERVRYRSIIISEDERGRASGDAWVELESREDLERTMDLNRKNMGARYIEVFEASMMDLDRARERQRGARFGERGGGGGGVGGAAGGRWGRPRGFTVQLKGLPYRSTEREIEDWLSEAADPIDVIIEMDSSGRPSGRADAIFQTSREAKRVVERMHRRDLGTRYIECYYMADEF